jgi:phosphoglucosamine mutase
VGRIFGTDGVRGVANLDLTPELAFAVGRAAAALLAGEVDAERPIVMGRDTRVSGTMLEAAVIAGITSVGRDVVVLGVAPTPATAFITRAQGAAAGVMITASHNPIEDNGIKLFGSDGFKLSDVQENDIEAHAGASDLPRPTHCGIGRAYARPELLERYIGAAVAAGGALDGLTIVVDPAFGAAYRIGPHVFERLGARVVRMHAQDDGTRINLACGATDMRALCERVLLATQEAPHAHVVGVAFDGDADRALFVDERGSTVSGDHVMLILACERIRRGTLPGNAVVGTVMSNIGLERALAAQGVALLRASVGDRYVLEMMRGGGYVLGGEQSGHIIDLARNTTGDGIMTAVALFSILVREKTRLEQAASALRVAPQILVNVRVADKDAAQRSAEVRRAVEHAQGVLAQRGRVLVRPSGTEPLVRVMMEGDDQREIELLAHEVAALIAQASPPL